MELLSTRANLTMTTKVQQRVTKSLTRNDGRQIVQKRVDRLSGGRLESLWTAFRSVLYCCKQGFSVHQLLRSEDKMLLIRRNFGLIIIDRVGALHLPRD
ncbi:hypothetical protein R1sor_000872 [Riccia sorocarpa]|uniref:Uncharacterized protein n=1 Tax=Riccia sorocarpa TaxID=122646 RepID=A0ABD3GXI0_9MARC